MSVASERQGQSGSSSNVGDQVIQQSKPSRIQEGWDRFYARSAVEVVELLERDDINLVVVNRLRELEDPVAIPALESVFRRSETATERLVIASALVRLGADDTHYFDLLERQAKVAAASDMPMPTEITPNGEVLKTISPQFLDWCESNNLAPAEAWRRMVHEYVLAIKLLAMAGDPRSVPTLLSILQSENFLFTIRGGGGTGLSPNTVRSARNHRGCRSCTQVECLGGCTITIGI